MKASLGAFKERLRAQGFKLTPQRLAIYRELVSTKCHPSAEWIYKKVKKEQPTISLATVYKTLEALEGSGLAMEVGSLSDSRHYDGNSSPHPHLICTSCDKVEDLMEVSTSELSRVAATASNNSGYEISSGRFTLYGVCPTCRSKSN